MTRTRRWAVPALVALAALVLLGTATPQLPALRSATGRPDPDDRGTLRVDKLFPQERPNIVVIMSDDARYDDLRFMPNARRLIGDKGVEFVNAFSPQPVCCPARASFLSGLYTHNHHVWSNAEPWGFQAFDDSSTLATWLHEVGYNTIFVGKYLNGYGVQPLPDGSRSTTYVPPGWTDWRGSVVGLGGTQYAGGTYRYYDTTLNVNGTFVNYAGRYQTRVFGQLSRQIIEQYARSPQPFFYWASYVAPHNGKPHEPDDPPAVTLADGTRKAYTTAARPPAVRGKFDDVIKEAPGAEGEPDVSDKPFFIREKPQLNDAQRGALRELTRQRAEALSVLDAQIADTIDALRETGELDNTIIVHVSDNGFFLGEHRMPNGKILPYDAALRVPLLIRGPGIPAGEVRTDPFLIPDFAPTFLEAAGASPEPVDGKSMLGVARHGDQGWSRPILTETGPREVESDIAESDNFLVKSDGPSPLRFSQGIRAPYYLYLEHASREKELYDLRKDPHELTNVVGRGDIAHVQRELAAVLDRMRNCDGEECRQPLPPDLQTPPGRPLGPPVPPDVG